MHINFFYLNGNIHVWRMHCVHYTNKRIMIVKKQDCIKK